MRRSRRQAPCATQDNWRGIHRVASLFQAADQPLAVTRPGAFKVPTRMVLKVSRQHGKSAYLRHVEQYVALRQLMVFLDWFTRSGARGPGA